MFVIVLNSEWFQVIFTLLVYNPLGKKHISDHTDPEGKFIILQMAPADQIKQDMINPEGYSSHSHGIATYHPYFVCNYIFFVNSAEPIKSNYKPPACHEHKQCSFPKTSFGKEGHVQAGGRTQEKDNGNINLARKTMDGFRFFQDISGKLDKGSKNTQGACSDMNIEWSII